MPPTMWPLIHETIPEHQALSGLLFEEEAAHSSQAACVFANRELEVADSL